jgi:hypothetical protein
MHQNGMEFLTLNALFGAIISADIFLVGFLISGVLADYKEAEKLPGELACSLETLTDECYIVHKNTQSRVTVEFGEHIREVTDSLIQWFYKEEKTTKVFERITGLNDHFAELEPLTAPPFIARLKSEQSNLRRIITRIHTIRETSFVPAGYAIAEFISIILCVGLIFVKMDALYESVFFEAFVSYILIYMVLLIRDLDDPFEHYQGQRQGDDEVSLKPLFDLQQRISGVLPSADRVETYSGHS